MGISYVDIKTRNRYGLTRRWKQIRCVLLVAAAMTVLYLLVSKWLTKQLDEEMNTKLAGIQIPRKPAVKHDDVMVSIAPDVLSNIKGQIEPPLINDGTGPYDGLYVDEPPKEIMAEIVKSNDPLFEYVEGNFDPPNDEESSYAILLNRYVEVPLQPKVELNDVVRTVIRIVKYFNDNIDNQTTDAFMALRMLEGQVDVLFTRMVGNNVKLLEGVSIPLIRALNDMRNKAKNLLLKAPEIVKITTANYTELEGLYQPETWHIYNPTNSVDANQYVDPDYMSKIIPQHSEKCMTQMTGTRVLPACAVDDNCWAMMTATGQTNTDLTRQVLYLLTGQGHKCQKMMEDFASKHKQVSYVQLYSVFCANVYKEMVQDLKAGINHEDLIFEQIFMCGMAGYKQFCPADVLKVLLEKQTDRGCYINVLPTLWSKVMKILGLSATKSSEDECSTRKTSAALGTAMVFIRYLIEDPVLDLNSFVSPL